MARPLEQRHPRVLIPVVAGIGNALMAVPMVRQLKRARPEAYIAVLARIAAMGEVFERLEEVDAVRIMQRGSVGMGRSMFALGREIRPDVVLTPFPSNRWQYAALAAVSGAAMRIQHSYPVGRIRALGFLPGVRVPAKRGLHDVAQNLELLRPLGIEPDPTEAPTFRVTDADRAKADELLAGLDARPIVIHAGSARTVLAAAKRWPSESYAALIDELMRAYGERIVILEGPDERGVGQEIALRVTAGRPRVLPLVGGLGDAAAVLQRAEFYVGTDSGLAHLAAAVGTPPVTLFAPADPDRVCPFGYRHLVVQPGCECAPCFLYPWEATRPTLRCRDARCIRQITVEAVMERVAVASRGG